MQRFFFLALIGLFIGATHPVASAATELRLALVVGISAYKTGASTIPNNDANLIAQALREDGFEVTAQLDLDEVKLRKAFSDFATKVGSAGPDTVAVIYYAGQGLQFRGENFLLPIDADPTAIGDTNAHAISLAQLTQSFAAQRLKALIFILDEARTIESSAPPLAGGFAWIEPEPNMLVAFNTAPGTVVRQQQEGAGPYARAIAEMLRDGSQTPTELFDRVRLRVNELTTGAQMPWHASKIDPQFILLAQNSDATATTDWRAYIRRLRAQPLKRIGVRDAYLVTLLRDTLDGYADFLADYWQEPTASRVLALLAARREAITWWRTYQRNIPEAYWTYLDRYPAGPHAPDARRLLSRLGASNDPPLRFMKLEYDVPPPLPGELPYLVNPGLKLDNPQFAFVAPPPMPVDLVGPHLQLSDGNTPAAMASPTEGQFVDPNADPAAVGSSPPNPLSQSKIKSDTAIRTNGSSIAPSDKLAAPPNEPLSNGTSEATKVTPDAALSLRQENTLSSQPPAGPASSQKLTTQDAISPSLAPNALGKNPNSAPAMVDVPAANASPQSHSYPQNTPEASAHRPAPAKRLTNPPTAAVGATVSPNAKQPLSLRGSVTPTGTTRVQQKPTVQSGLVPNPNQQVSMARTRNTPKVVGAPSAKPNPTTRVLRPSCSDLDGRETCH